MDGCDRADDDLVLMGWGLDGGGGSLGCDFPGASFPGWPLIRSRRLVGGFLLNPISAWEEVPWRSASVKLGSPKSPEGSLDESTWSNTPNSSSDWPNLASYSLPSAPTSSTFAACWDKEEPANVAPPRVEDPSGSKKPCSVMVIL